jgi:hypothetical protein
MIGPIEVLKDVVAKFEKLGLDYFLVGSLAAMYYSRPRFTNDIDLVVQIPSIKIREFETHFPIEEYYCPPFEVLSDEVIRKGSFNLIHQLSGIKIDLVLNKANEFYLNEFSRRVKVTLIPNFQAFIASPEDIILKKLEFYQEGQSQKHLLDIQEILAANKIDLVYLQKWVTKLNLFASWELVSK